MHLAAELRLLPCTPVGAELEGSGVFAVLWARPCLAAWRVGLRLGFELASAAG